MTTNPDACPNPAAFRAPDTGRGICLHHARQLVELLSGIGQYALLEPVSDDDPLPCEYPVHHATPAA